MKHKGLLTYIICLMLAICDYTYAHDFEADNIYYKIISKTDKTCKTGIYNRLLLNIL